MNKALEEIFAVIDELKERFDWGGSEDSEGALLPGTPDWEGAKRKIREILAKTAQR